jgi:hypothetical protein
MNFDGRAVFGILDPRTPAYVNDLKGPAPNSDLFGQRREMYLAASVGLARIIQVKEKFKGRSSSKPKSYPKPATRKPKG